MAARLPQIESNNAEMSTTYVGMSTTEGTCEAVEVFERYRAPFKKYPLLGEFCYLTKG